MKRPSPKRIAVMGMFLGLAAALLLFAHEGHKAITVKGVKFRKDGRLTMQELNRTAIGLKTWKVGLRDMEETIEINARAHVPWDRRAFASARIPGIISAIHVRPGQTVKAGEVLAEIESLQLESLQLQLLNALVERKLAEENLERVKALGEVIVTGIEILRLESEFEEAKNAVESLMNRLRIVGLTDVQLERLIDKSRRVRTLPIVAPVGGSVVHLDVAIGKPVEPTEHLFEISDTSRIWIRGDLPEIHFGRVKVGMEARFLPQAYKGRAWSGKISRLEYHIDPDTRTMGVWMEIDNPDRRIKEGMFGRLQVVLSRGEVLAVPLSAIVEEGAEQYAVVQEKPGLYRRADLLLGRRQGGFVEVKEGLVQGDEVVTDGSHQISALYVQGAIRLSKTAWRAIGLRTEEVDVRPIDRVVSLPAVLRAPPDRLGISTPRIVGKVKRIGVTVGSRVSRGDALAEITSLELERTQLDLIQESLRLDLFARQLAYLERMSEHGIPPRKEIARLRSRYQKQMSVVQTLRRTLRVMGIGEGQLKQIVRTRKPIETVPVTSPVTGIVASVKVVPGQVVRPGDHLFEVLDPTVLLVEAFAFERDLQELEPLDTGGSFEVVTAAGVHLGDARIESISQRLEGAERVALYRANVRNPAGRAVPGMLASVTAVLERGTEEVISVPQAALLEISGKRYAFVHRKNRFVRVQVRTGREDHRYAEVIDGLFPGDRVAVTGLGALNRAHGAIR